MNLGTLATHVFSFFFVVPSPRPCRPLCKTIRRKETLLAMLSHVFFLPVEVEFTPLGG